MDKLSQYKQKNQNKKILIFGLGLQGGGLSSALFFSNFTQNLRITDLKSEEKLKDSLEKLKNIKFDSTFGQHKNEDIEWADIIVFNQDIFNKAPNSPNLKLALDLGKQIETEIGLFIELCQCPVIGVTGTRGKTTTTIAISKLLKNYGYKIYLGGNIPDSQNLNNVKKTKDFNYAVLELSNFQLHGLNFKKISPHISVVTSISPDHLISYQNMEDYVEDKTTICKYQKETDHLIINKDIEFINNFISNTKAQITYFDSNTIPSNLSLKLSGLHNRQNMGAVWQVGKILNIPNDLITSTISNFESVEFRLQKIAQINGITFVNDSTASTPTAALIALKSFPSDKIIWICGGNSKNLPMDDLLKYASQNVRKFVFLKGDATQNLINELEKSIPDFSSRNLGLFDNFKLAVEIAYKNSREGDYVLLSPGFTSFAMFENEFDRGRQFNQIVQNNLK